MSATDYLNDLNHRYLAIHRRKEDLFWQTYMGISDDHEGAAAALADWTNFLSDASYLSAIKEQLAKASLITDERERQATIQGLSGWQAMFEAHAIESAEAKKLKDELIAFEAKLFEKKQNHVMSYLDEHGQKVEASLPLLRTVMNTNTHEKVRQSAHQALLDVEQWLLENGFLELVKRRNAFAKALGFDNFFDYSVTKTEHMSSTELFSILDDFEQRTRDANLRSLSELSKNKGEQSLKAHNFVYSFAGDVMRELDPYVPFSQSLRRWVESFGRLGIDYSQAELTLDLLDRKGKYQNGFCHGPIPSFYDQDKWIAAKVNFTSNAKPDQIGSGYSGINTLFHEGGHAAHFANVKMNAPCFSQEFAPTSMAYAETQSMFCDSLLGDADWLKTYAKDANGKVIPDSVIQAMINANQPFKAYEERSILVVPYFERALYQLDDNELTPERVTKLARECEQQILGIACSPRPLMAIPHLLSDESACSYQGYLLAHMAVYQTRDFFTRQFGYLTDNAQIGPMLAKHYWNNGNSQSLDACIQSLCGEGFNAKYLADVCNLTTEQAWLAQQQKIAALNSRERVSAKALNASIRIVDGDTQIAANTHGDDHLYQQFESYIAQTYGC
ncbi:M3 family metallopeptidase [Celerinatantimonas sp. MCCC 1A17872]|uniref:M3 family metallopeptidase n=1 Tax=Celerinatantimonas sp. MCCC 1A17872 TaxID=3177514 RepID=UPI0038C81250